MDQEIISLFSFLWNTEYKVPVVPEFHSHDVNLNRARNLIHVALIILVYIYAYVYTFMQKYIHTYIF
jgi:hypothetical protein